MTISLDEALAVLTAHTHLPVDDPVRQRIERTLYDFTHHGRRLARADRKRARAAEQAALVAQTATGAADRKEDVPLDERDFPIFIGEVASQRCYVCKTFYTRIDGFYHRLCPPCAAENRGKRRARTDLSGRTAIVTGGRAKIGFELALKLLRDGADVTVTSRFPYDTQQRFSAAPDFADWAGRLHIVALDFRDPSRLLAWCDELLDAGRPLDILVNNAAQTIRRPPEAYAALIAAERAALPPGARPVFELESETAGVRSASLVDAAGLLPDTDPVNSWTRRVHEVDPVELLEVQLVNVTAPFLLVSRLLPLMLRSSYARRYIVNVSAVEGQFGRTYKSPGHPHTNMAKAALNMLTRTSAEDLAAQGVYLTSVDTGWITDEKPAPWKSRVAAAGFRTPLDIVDGAARVYDPIVRGEQGELLSGCFLKDYRVAPW